MVAETTYDVIEFPEVVRDLSGMASLAKKMAQVMGAVNRIEKNGKHPHHHYPYATSDDIFQAVRLAMSAANLAVFPNFVSFHQDPVGKQVRTYAVFEFTFVCGDTGASKVCRWEAEADDTQDKGINKVATAALKNFLLKAFVMSTGESDEDTEANPTPAELPMTRDEFVREMKALGYATEKAIGEALKKYELQDTDGLKKYEIMLERIKDYQAQETLMEFVAAPEPGHDAKANYLAALEEVGITIAHIGNSNLLPDGTFEIIPNSAGHLNTWSDMVRASKELTVVRNGMKSLVVKWSEG